MSTQEHIYRIDDFIKDERVIAVAADGEAFLVGRAGLLDVNVHIANCADDAQGIVHQPTGVGIGDETVVRLEHRSNGTDALYVGSCIAANLELKSGIAFRTICSDALRHGLGRFLRYGAIQTEIIPIPAAKKNA
jgi:hypothetical protein